MNKYYVSSGTMREIVTAEGPIEAARAALQKSEGVTLDHFFYVDERGFRGPNDVVQFDTLSMPAYMLDMLQVVPGLIDAAEAEEDDWDDYDDDEYRY